MIRSIGRALGVLLVLVVPGGLTLIAGAALYYWTKRRLRAAGVLSTPSMPSSELRRRLEGRPPEPKRSRPSRPTRYAN